MLVSQSVIEKHLIDYKSSNQSVAAYCRSHTIPSSTFRGWQKRYGQTQKSGTSLSKQDFITLPLASRSTEAQTSGSIKVSQTILELSGDVSSTLVESLVSALQYKGFCKC